MFKPKFIILKNLFIPFCICLFTLFLLIFSNTNLISAKNGLKLWANSVVPSLLPFFIATELLGYTNIVSFLGKLLNKLMRPIFNVPGEGAFPFIMGVISGYPVGAKIVSNLRLHGKLTNIEAERLIAYSNNSGPLFIIGTVGIGLFKNTSIGILLFITHVLAGLSVGYVFRWWKSGSIKRFETKPNKPLLSQKTVNLSNLGEVLSNSIMSAINSILLIGGFIVLFSVIISILESSGILNVFSNLLIPILSVFKISTSFANGIASGILELTNGVCKIAQIPNKSISTNIITCSFLLGFGGISVSLQILSIISKAKISIKPYLIGKLLQGSLAAVYTYLFICYIPIFNLNL